jgi:hypothetical protein
MPPTKEISYGEKVTIRHMFGLGIPAKEIGAKLGRHPASIRKHIAIIKTLPPNELLPPPKKRPGRQRLSNERLDRRLRHYVQKFPFKTAKELKREVPGWENMSIRYIQKTLQKRLDLPARNAAKDPLLTLKVKDEGDAQERSHYHLRSQAGSGIDVSVGHVHCPGTNSRRCRKSACMTEGGCRW